MIPLSQKDPKYKDLRFGAKKLSIKDYGCLIVSLCSLADKDPLEIVPLLNKSNCFDANSKMYPAIAAPVVGLIYKGSKGSPNIVPCIFETDHFRNQGVPQHFGVWLGKNGLIMDPLTGTIKSNKYRIISYRLFISRGDVNGKPV